MVSEFLARHATPLPLMQATVPVTKSRGNVLVVQSESPLIPISGLLKESLGGQKLEQDEQVQEHVYHFLHRLKTICSWVFRTCTSTEVRGIGQYLHSETEVPSCYTFTRYKLI
jgi:hypothetical protein